ncbi:uncharacterized protein LOC114175729 [Vigna unguiculata]|uniref:Uncharacterized protein n=1 Tax=Vigna unguiculata TaxID=3917 RepID=A0A4D6KYG1_VIGUN|nr:uncharacterized protein LOC114175729 [Vigna unguiculata]QCD79731.1 hypothetical protein DEO72_LG2g45 [Vigna unguiculata]
MGNCCKAASSSKVLDEGDGLCSEKVQKKKMMETLGVSPDPNGKVKIKISKKELAELFDKKELGRASAEQLLLRFITKGRENDGGHRSWRPVLETISEV